MTRFEIAERLRRIADLIELTASSPSAGDARDARDGRFRAQAYRKAGRALESANAFDTLLATRRLSDLPGVGKTLAALITELATTGRAALEDELLAAIPPGALALAEVAGLGTIEKLSPLGLDSLEALVEACLAGRVAALPGLGDKTEERLLAKARAAIERRDAPPALLYSEARALLDPLIGAIAALPGVVDVDLAGATARAEELVHDLELLVLTSTADTLADLLPTLPEVVAVDPLVFHPGRPATLTFTLAPRTPVRLHVAPPDDPLASLHAIGPAPHLAALGLDTPSPPSPTEAALYAAFGLQVPPPELRDLPLSDLRSCDAAPYRLLEPFDVLGLVHCHSLHSDGRHSILELARHAVSLGYRYLTITDHSPTASYARGVTQDRIARQWDEIALAREETGLDILRGTESDILADGALDYPDWLLAELDVVIVSIHNRHQQDAAAMTRRLVTALRHPVRKIWGHPLGRLLRERPPIACDMDAVLEALVASNTVVELNGDPKRMDLPAEWARRAAALGLDFVVSADAHAAPEMRYLANSVALARRTGLSPDRVLNTLDAAAFRARVRPFA